MGSLMVRVIDTWSMMQSLPKAKRNINNHNKLWD